MVYGDGEVYITSVQVKMRTDDPSQWSWSRQSESFLHEVISYFIESFSVIPPKFLQQK